MTATEIPYRSINMRNLPEECRNLCVLLEVINDCLVPALLKGRRKEPHIFQDIRIHPIYPPHNGWSWDAYTTKGIRFGTEIPAGSTLPMNDEEARDLFLIVEALCENLVKVENEIREEGQEE